MLATDPRSGARLVPAGKPVPNPADLLGSPQMKRFLTRLAEDHDFVILDLPPVLAVSDARVLARVVDRTVFLARWAGTRRKGDCRLAPAGRSWRQVAGVALTLVDVRRHAQYGYSDPVRTSGGS